MWVLGVMLVIVILLIVGTMFPNGPVANAGRRVCGAFSRNSSGGCTSCAGASSATPAAATTSGFVSGPEGMTVSESVRVVSKLGGVFDREDVPAKNDVYMSSSPDGSYDPIQMGALKPAEVAAHKHGFEEMTPFNYLGPVKPSSTLRDDDEYTRNTGVTWVGGRPRTVKQVASGPQAGARNVVSASDKDIQETHLISMYEPTWG